MNGHRNVVLTHKGALLRRKSEEERMMLLAGKWN
jgi:hypothetical protein